jgi:hypothetical protein
MIRSTGVILCPLVEQVVRMPEVIAAMLREHVSTPEGRCAVCPVGNHGAGTAHVPSVEFGRRRPGQAGSAAGSLK